MMDCNLKAEEAVDEKRKKKKIDALGLKQNYESLLALNEPPLRI